MTGDKEGSEWFGGEPVTTEPDPAEGTDQNWFDDLAFRPTPTGEAPDPDHNLGTYRPSEPADGSELNLSVTSSLQAGIGSENEGETETESENPPPAESDEPASIETGGDSPTAAPDGVEPEPTISGSPSATHADASSAVPTNGSGASGGDGPVEGTEDLTESDGQSNGEQASDDLTESDDQSNGEQASDDSAGLFARLLALLGL